MKRFPKILLIVFLLLPKQAWSLDVIPGLKVFGGTTRAAYGNNTNPTIYCVNTLNPTTELTNSTRNGVAVKQGGLKSAIDHDVDNKLIIFEVGGAIVYYGELKIDNDYITIAGQTAPSPGISIYGTQLTVTGDHILIQHLRIRAGDNTSGVSPDNRNCVESYGSNVIFDHCSFSWATDTNFAFSGLSQSPAKNMTLSNSIISEGLADSIHSKGSHSYSINIMRDVVNCGIINNLIAHSVGRNPRTYDGGQTQQTLIANNVIYNPGIYNIVIDTSTGVSDYNIVGNVSIGGPNSTEHVTLNIPDIIRSQNTSSDIYIVDNKFCVSQNGACNTQGNSSDWDHVRTATTVPTIESLNKSTSLTFSYPTNYTPMVSAEVEAYVLSNVGARPSNRDVVDQRIINEWQSGTGRIIDYIVAQNLAADCYPNCIRNAEAGWPKIGTGRTIHNDIPANPHADDDSDGYTNLEEWLHELAAQVEGISKGFSLSPPDGLKIITK